MQDVQSFCDSTDGEQAELNDSGVPEPDSSHPKDIWREGERHLNSAPIARAIDTSSNVHAR